MSDTPLTPRGVVLTIAAKCRRCYNCVRSCPAKAIRVQGGQACVLAERCIGCGNCLRVCGQDAKQVLSAVETVSRMLASETPAVALLAPSYPAAFDMVSAEQLVAALRRLGFARVMEVGLGAEMVAAEYAKLLAGFYDRPIISSPCPALVSYVEKYLPELVPNLAPVASPMVVLGRAVKAVYLHGANVVFIGPCVAKKMEMLDPALAGAVDAVMTFQELETLLEQAVIVPRAMHPSDPDGPLPHYGSIFAISGGLLKAAAVQADVMDDCIVVAEGPERCLAALREVQEGQFPGRFLDLLFCEGCIAGPAFVSSMSLLSRRARVTAHVRRLRETATAPLEALRAVAEVPTGREFLGRPINLKLPDETELRDILAKSSKFDVEDELNCGACGYATCREKAIASYQGLAEPEMCLPYLIDQLQVNLEKLSRSKQEIEKAREQAARAQELASMGQLAADIAHEISSPLTQVVVFAQLLRDSMPEDDPRREDVAAIVAEALHCRDVMSGLQGFAHQRQPMWEEIEVRTVVEQALAEIQARLDEGHVALKRTIPPDLPVLVADSTLLQQVLVNVLNNSLDATAPGNEIEILARVTDDAAAMEVVVRDTGRGIPSQLLPQVMQPFVTTKKNRRGAGLGLSVAHGVVRAHGGEISIASKAGEGTQVTIRLPLDTAPRADSAEAAKVLLVDDDPDFLEIHRVKLEAMGFRVLTAERSDEVFEVADREIPDAFVLDLMMERMDSGARLARALRRDPRFRHSPIILLTSVVEVTGFEFQRNPQEVLNWMKIDAWFEKPAPMAELGNALRRLLSSGTENGAASETP